MMMMMMISELKVSLVSRPANYIISVTDPVISCVYSIDRGCKDDCDLITLGSYKTVDNYELNGAKDMVS